MKLPCHIAIICDGNRRWAKKKGLPEFSGHKYATDHTIEKIVDQALELKIPYLTFWVLSPQNWRRGQKWIEQYFKLMHYFFDKKLDLLLKKGAKIIASGDLAPFPQPLKKKIDQVISQSKNNQHITINIAINYGGRDEILRAIKKIPPAQIPSLTPTQFSSYLDHPELPHPDLLIRTGNNNTRLSGFMLWQTAYTQLYFTPTLFPDFSPQQLDQAIAWWQTQTNNLGR